MFLEKNTALKLGAELNPRGILFLKKTNKQKLTNSKTKPNNLKTKSMKQEVSRLFTEPVHVEV